MGLCDIPFSGALCERPHEREKPSTTDKRSSPVADGSGRVSQDTRRGQVWAAIFNGGQPLNMKEMRKS